MKYKFRWFLIILILFVVKHNSYSQSKSEIFDENYANWVATMISYVQKYENTIPDEFSSWMISSFYSNTKDKYESFNGSLLTFLSNEYQDSLKRSTLYFIQKYNGSYSHGNHTYLILDNSNLVTDISYGNEKEFNWKKKKVIDFDFESFENKFDSLDDFEICQKNHGGFFYYLITKFDKGTIKIKIIDLSCDLIFN